MNRPSDQHYQAALLPAESTPAEVIVLERGGQWAAALRRALHDLARFGETSETSHPERSHPERSEGSCPAVRARFFAALSSDRTLLRLRETRLADDAWDLLRHSPASFLIAQWTPAAAAGLAARLLWLGRDFPLARAALVADRPWAEAACWLQGLGLVAVVTSPRRLGPLAAAVRRHLALIPPPPRPLTEQIWSELPWA